MTPALRVALLGRADELADALRAAGQQPTVITPEGPRPLARLMECRGIGDGHERVPAALLALARGSFDVAHALTPVDALAAIAWARRRRRPVVLSFDEPVRRETVADRRLRLVTLERALAGADRVLATDRDVAASLSRLLALDAEVVAPSDAAAHLAVYRSLGAG